MTKKSYFICPECDVKVECDRNKIKFEIAKHYESQHSDIVLSSGVVHRIASTYAKHSGKKRSQLGITGSGSIYTFSGGAGPGTGKKR